MAEVSTDTPLRTLDLNVLNWRFAELERAGYPVELATLLAENSEVDLHFATDLLERGCSVERALRILT